MNAYYPAGVTEGHIATRWIQPRRNYSETTELEDKCEAIRKRMDEIEKKELYLKTITPEEEDEYSKLEIELTAAEDELQRISDYDEDEDDKWRRADAMINERLGK